MYFLLWITRLRTSYLWFALRICAYSMTSPLKLHPLRMKKRQISLWSASLTELLDLCLVRPFTAGRATVRIENRMKWEKQNKHSSNLQLFCQVQNNVLNYKTNRISASFSFIHLSPSSWKLKKQSVTWSCKACGVFACFLDWVLGHSGFYEHLHRSCGPFCKLLQTYSHPAGSAGRGAGCYRLS